MQNKKDLKIYHINNNVNTLRFNLLQRLLGWPQKILKILELMIIGGIEFIKLEKGNLFYNPNLMSVYQEDESPEGYKEFPCIQKNFFPLEHFRYGSNSFIVCMDENNKLQVFCLGNNSYGELGLGHTRIVRKFTKIDIDFTKIRTIKSIHQLVGHMSETIIECIGNDNITVLFGAGGNYCGELGLGDYDLHLISSNHLLEAEEVEEEKPYSRHIPFVSSINDLKSQVKKYYIYGLDEKGNIHRTPVLNKNKSIYDKLTFTNKMTKLEDIPDKIKNNIISNEGHIPDNTGIVRKFTKIDIDFKNIHEIKYIHNLDEGALIECIDHKNRLVLFVAGYNSYGELALGHTSIVWKFTKIDIDFKNIHEIKYIHTLTAGFILECIDNYNRPVLFGVGYNYHGQLGLGHYNHVNRFTKIGIDFTNIRAIKCIHPCGSDSIIIECIDDKNRPVLFGAGNNHYSKLGLGNAGNIKKFTKIGIDFTNIRAIKCIHPCQEDVIIIECIDDKNRPVLFGAGGNYHGELGLGHTKKVSKFTKIGIDFTNIRAIKCIHPCQEDAITIECIDDNNQLVLFGAGDNRDGQLGLGNAGDIKKFTRVKSIDIFKLTRHQIKFFTFSLNKAFIVLMDKLYNACYIIKGNSKTQKIQLKTPPDFDYLEAENILTIKAPEELEQPHEEFTNTDSNTNTNTQL